MAAALSSFVTFLMLLLLLLLQLLFSTIGCLEREREALLHFKHGLVDDYGILSSWKGKADCCLQWRGHVIKLHLPAPFPGWSEKTHEYKCLRGEISLSLAELQHLTHLDLSFNDFEATPIPPFLASSLNKLQYLNLSHANFTGPLPIQLGNSSNLLSLDLSGNDFEGRLIPPLFLSSLTKIQHLTLSHANFAGPLPSQLGNLSNLLSLDLNGIYGLSSENLEWLSHLPSLVHLNLRNCSVPPLTSTTPSLPVLFPVNSSAPLAFLDLSCNHYDFTSSIYPWLFNFSDTLIHIDLSSNDNLNGSIPEAFGSVSSLAFLDMSWSGVQGSIPVAFGNMSSLAFLDLSDNQLQGSIPGALGKTSSLTYLDLSYNELQGSIPDAVWNMSSLTYLDLYYNQLQGSIPDAVGNMSSLTDLDLSSNQLQGSIPDAVGNMSSLTYLDLSYNQLQGTIPDAVWDMSSLTYLYLSYNQLQGSISDAVGNMSSLTYLDLSHNQLQGSIPDAVGSMSSLTYLDLSHNQLQGSIPDAVGNLALLQQLDLSENKLDGEIPKSLCNLCHLQALHLQGNNISGHLSQVLDLLACAYDTLATLYLSDNQFTGSIPDLTRFSSLRILELGYNQLHGTLPTSIGQLTELEELDIGSNSLQGAISGAHLLHLYRLYSLDLSSNSLSFNMSSQWVPPFQLNYLFLTSCKLGSRFPSWLQTQKHLRGLDISNSEISDFIPNWFWNLTSKIYSFNISSNQLTGTLPDLSSKFDHPFYIDMSSNDLGGSILQLPSDLAWLDLSNNKFSGSISSMCTVSHSYLVYLDLSNNSLSGELPNCQPQWRSLTILNLENNQFFGKIPKSFGSLQSIQSLHLRNNNLSGEFPSSLKKCTNLSFVDLAQNKLYGKIPPWIGESLKNLQVLNLRYNKFSGSISSKLCQLKRIQILDLSSNYILGTIPKCLSKFTAMTKKGNLTIAYNYGSIENSLYGRESWSYVDRELVKWKGREFVYKNTLGLVKSIDLSSNNLIGGIPKEVTDLLELVSLNFSRNNLTGLIPITIGQLRSLEVLDLSQNQLIGGIPDSLSEIDRLSMLDLSSNNLSGKIPQGTQLQSFNASAYEGNPSLCGLPLSKRCLADKAKRAPSAYKHEGSIQQDGNDLWFYVSIALGFITGFWGVCGTLLLNNSWRYAYIRFLNKIKDWFYVTTTINMARLWKSFKIKRSDSFMRDGEKRVREG